MTPHERRPRQRGELTADLGIVLLVVAFLVLSVFLKAEIRDLESAEPDLLPVGAQAPSLRAPTLTGDIFSLDQYLSEHQLVAVTFWASWCQPCKPELERLSYLYSLHPSELGVVAISLDDDTLGVQEQVAELALPFPVLLDTNMESAAQFGVSSIPTTFLISTSGDIEVVMKGFQTGLDMAVEYHLDTDGS